MVSVIVAAVCVDSGGVWTLVGGRLPGAADVFFIQCVACCTM
jgi:hypothetical protein